MFHIAGSMFKDLLGVALLTTFYMCKEGWLGPHQAKCCKTREDGVHIIYLLRVWLSSLYTIHCAPLSAFSMSVVTYLFGLCKKGVMFCISSLLVIFLSHDICLVPLASVCEVVFWIIICIVPPPQPSGLPPDKADHHWRIPLHQAPSGYMLPQLTPFPGRYLILTGVCLLQAFIGYLTKLGANFMGAVAQIANCASNLSYLIVFRSRKTREAAHQVFKNHRYHYYRKVIRFKKKVKRIWADSNCKSTCRRRMKHIGQYTYYAHRKLYMMAAIFTLTLAINTMVTSVEGLRYVQKKTPRPLRQWRKFRKHFQAVDTTPIIVALPAYLVDEGDIHGVYAEWDDSCDHVVLDSGSTHTILYQEKLFVGKIRPTTAQILGATGPGPADGEGTAKFSITR